MIASKSSQRHTFQMEGVINRAKEKGIDPETDEATLATIELYKSFAQSDEDNLKDPEWQKDNLEYDLRTTDWILEKVRSSDDYAQNLYASMCNTDFTKNEVWPILQGQTWSCSWRHAGGIIADMRQEGDYVDWYCSGVGSVDGVINNYVGEGTVTDEIRKDLLKMGWLVKECD